ncbi:MAG TPA: prepilin-type N-terminal cleavage/methylation domain-containing protein [Candidatus Paceibacterota bacterium]
MRIKCRLICKLLSVNVIQIFNIEMSKYLNIQISKYQQGFTLLETLVALAIMMIAIASAFGLAPEGLVGARFAKNQTAATYLAQEGLEIVHNMRDSAMFFAPNLANPDNWLINISGCIGRKCVVNPVEEKLEVCGSSCPPLQSVQTLDGGLAYGNGLIFASDSTVQNTIFTREITVTKVRNEIIGRDDTEAVITVKVSWKEGRVTKVTEISETLFDWWTFTK